MAAPLRPHVRGGAIAGEGHTTLSWEAQRAHVRRLEVAELTADDVRGPTTAAAEGRRFEKGLRLAEALVKQLIAVRIDEPTRR